MKKKRNRTIAVIISVISIILIGSTLAYFTSVDRVTNRFNAGKIDITLTESNWKPENGLEVLPGDVIEKNPSITSNEETECYVYMRVTVPCYSPELEYDSGNKGMVRPSDTSPLPMYKFVLISGEDDLYDDTTTWNQYVHSCWTLVGEVEKTGNYLEYVYAYTDESGNLTALKKDESTKKPLFDKIKVCNFNEKYLKKSNGGQGNYNIKVEAFAIQSDFLSAENNTVDEVWKMIRTGE